MLQPKLIELLEELFSIGGNHDIKKKVEIRQKIIDFMTADNLFLKNDDDNFIMIKDTIRFIDAQNEFAITTNRDGASAHIKCFFDRISKMQPEQWNYYELKLLVSSLFLIEKIDQAFKLGDNALIAIQQFEDINKVDVFKSSVACNICCRILYAKYFDNVKTNLSDQFERWFEKLEVLAKEDNHIALDYLVTQIRKAVFYQKRDEIRELLEELETKHNKKIFDVVFKEVSIYYPKFDFRTEGGDV